MFAFVPGLTSPCDQEAALQQAQLWVLQHALRVAGEPIRDTHNHITAQQTITLLRKQRRAPCAAVKGEVPLICQAADFTVPQSRRRGPEDLDASREIAQTDTWRAVSAKKGNKKKNITTACEYQG